MLCGACLRGFCGLPGHPRACGGDCCTAHREVLNDKHAPRAGLPGEAAHEIIVRLKRSGQLTLRALIKFSDAPLVELDASSCEPPTPARPSSQTPPRRPAAHTPPAANRKPQAAAARGTLSGARGEACRRGDERLAAPHRGALARAARPLGESWFFAPPPPSSRTNWTRLVPPLVLTGHVSSLLPY